MSSTVYKQGEIDHRMRGAFYVSVCVLFLFFLCAAALLFRWTTQMYYLEGAKTGGVNTVEWGMQE